MPYTIEGAIEKLGLAEAIRTLEFSVFQADGETHSFSASCWNEKHADELVAELNEAIRPVKDRWLSRILDEVNSNFPRPD